MTGPFELRWLVFVLRFCLCIVQKVGRRFDATFRKRDGHSREEGFPDFRCEQVGRESRGPLWFSFPLTGCRTSTCDGCLFLLEPRASDLKHIEKTIDVRMIIMMDVRMDIAMDITKLFCLTTSACDDTPRSR